MTTPRHRLPHAFLSLMLVVVPTAQAVEVVEGVWRISTIARDSVQEPNRDPQPSLLVFTAGHYSMVWTPTDEAMRAYAERWSPTDDEKIKRHSEVVVNAGTYEIKGSQIKTFPLVARDPDLIDGYVLYEYKWLDGNLVLTMVDEYSFDGVQHPWVKRGRIHLTLSRVSE